MSLTNLNKFQLENSDVITYHTYEGVNSHQQLIDTLKQYGRPMICTEYMARTQNSTFQDIMPMLKRENIGAINWGLVAGKQIRSLHGTLHCLMLLNLHCGSTIYSVVMEPLFDRRSGMYSFIN